MTFPSDLDLKELLPCPFCGGHVDVEKTHIGPMGRQFWGVKCRNTRNVGGTCAIEQIPSGSRETAIARWNSRATPVAPVPVELVVAGPTPDYTGEGSAWVPPVEEQPGVVRSLATRFGLFPDDVIEISRRVRAIPADRVLGEGMVAVDRRIIEKFTSGCHEWMPGLGRCGDQYPGGERQLCSKCTPLRDALRANQGGAEHGNG